MKPQIKQCHLDLGPAWAASCRSIDAWVHSSECWLACCIPAAPRHVHNAWETDDWLLEHALQLQSRGVHASCRRLCMPSFCVALSGQASDPATCWGTVRWSIGSASSSSLSLIDVVQQAGPLPAVDYYLVALLLQISNSVWLVGVARGTARGVMKTYFLDEPMGGVYNILHD